MGLHRTSLVAASFFSEASELPEGCPRNREDATYLQDTFVLSATMVHCC